MIIKKYYLVHLTTYLLLLKIVSGQEISTVGQVYDFNIGDEFHISDHQEYYMGLHLLLAKHYD